MHWRELQQTYIPELKMNFGQAVSALKKSWKAYKIAGRTGEPRSDISYRICSIQSALGIEKSEFPELEGMYDEDEDQLTEVGMTGEEHCFSFLIA